MWSHTWKTWLAATWLWSGKARQRNSWMRIKSLLEVGGDLKKKKFICSWDHKRRQWKRKRTAGQKDERILHTGSETGSRLAQNHQSLRSPISKCEPEDLFFFPRLLWENKCMEFVANRNDLSLKYVEGEKLAISPPPWFPSVFIKSLTPSTQPRILWTWALFFP